MNFDRAARMATEHPDGLFPIFEKTFSRKFAKLKEHVLKVQLENKPSEDGLYQIQKDIICEIEDLPKNLSLPQLSLSVTLAWDPEKPACSLDVIFFMDYGGPKPSNLPEYWVEITVTGIYDEKLNKKSETTGLEKVVMEQECYISTPDIWLELPVSNVNDIKLDEDGDLTVEIKSKLYVVHPKVKKAMLIFKRNANAQFASLLDDHELADVKIVTKGGQIKAHKTILAARCPALMKGLTTSGKGGQSGIIKMDDDISFRTVKFLLHYFYASGILPFGVGKEDPEKPCISELIHAADKFVLDDLLDFFDGILGEFVTEENVLFLIRLANKFSLKIARKDIDAFVTANLPLVPSIIDAVQ